MEVEKLKWNEIIRRLNYKIKITNTFLVPFLGQ